jgi:membrane complex biogenesis BtpA family protein
MVLDLTDTFDTSKPVVGMVHLRPLPGSPGYDERTVDRESVRRRAVTDAEALDAGGVDAVMVENFGDGPFYPDDVPKHVVADLTAATVAVSDAVSVPVGVNVLRNDGPAAMAVAGAVNGAFVRVNVHTGVAVTDQGLLEGQAHETMRLRDRIDADVAVMADVDVKHAAPLADRPFETEIDELATRGRADAVVVSGRATGAETPIATVERAREALDAVAIDPAPPLFVGSGVTPETVGDVLPIANGVVVGTALKEHGPTEEGVTTAPVDEDRVADIVAAADEVR